MLASSENHRRFRLPPTFLLALFLAQIAVAQSFIIQHVTVIDATGAPPRRDFSVTVRGGKITAIAKTLAKAPIKASSDVDTEPVIIDATGKFLIPGLWDMHFHLTAPDVVFPLLVANGITGIREMYSASSIATVRGWSMLPNAPRIVVSGFIDGPQPRPNGSAWPDAFAAADAESAQAAVQVLASQGADFVKVYSGLPRAAFLAIAAESRAIGIPFAGHVPEEVSPLEASNAGMRSQEHFINILLAASTRENELRADRIATMNDPQLSGAARLRLLAWPLTEGLIDTYDPQKATVLFKTFVRNSTWQTPTLTVLAGFAHAMDEDFIADPRRRYIPKAWTAAWDPRVSPYLRDLSTDEYQALNQRMRALLARYMKLVNDMRKAGVEFLAGTDTNPLNPVLPGWGLHQELALLVESGLTPLQALQTATRNPARYFGTLREMGTVEIGKAADLVLLDADPLQDIHNTQKISAVMVRGRYYPREELDTMLQASEAAAQ